MPKFENNGKRDLWAYNKWKEIGALHLKRLIKDGFLFIETSEVEDTKATLNARLTAIPGKANESLITKNLKMTYPFRFDYQIDRFKEDKYDEYYYCGQVKEIEDNGD